MENNTRIKIMVVDDSAFMRSALKGMIQTDPDLEVIATARDGEEAIEKVKMFQPDIVTMDLEMPRMDGLTATRIIMQEMPLPILVVSSLTEDGAQATFEALDAGAVDYISKNLQARSLNIMNVQEDLISRIKSICKRKIRFKKNITRIKSLKDVIIPEKKQFAVTGGSTLLVAIGVSTGGPKALQEVIPFLPKELSAGVVIVQHMPAAFTKSFAERLNSLSQLEVKEAEHGDIVKPGKVIIAKGGVHMHLNRTRLDVTVELSDIPKDSLYKPSVNEMMLSAAKAYGGRLLGVIMTGMGNDGCIGMHAIKNKGGKTMTQDEESSVIYGMPKAVVDDGLVDKVVSLELMASEIVNMV